MTVAELLAQGVPPHPHEAVALVLAFADDAGARSAADPNDGAISPATITLDGSGVVSSSDQTVGALSPRSVATLLHQLLEGTPQVPPGLVYAISRARGEVLAPPFESLEAFLRTLKRFERGSRRDALVKWCVRIDVAACSEEVWQWRDRRRTPMAMSHLRRELRAMDRRDYERQQAAYSIAARDAGARAAGQAPRRRWAIAAAMACATIGLAGLPMIGAMRATPDVLAATRVSPVGPLPEGAATTQMRQTLQPAVSAASITPNSSTLRAKRVGARRSRKPSAWRTIFGFGWMRHLVGARQDR